MYGQNGDILLSLKLSSKMLPVWNYSGICLCFKFDFLKTEFYWKTRFGKNQVIGNQKKKKSCHFGPCVHLHSWLYEPNQKGTQIDYQWLCFNDEKMIKFLRSALLVSREKIAKCPFGAKITALCPLSQIN